MFTLCLHACAVGGTTTCNRVTENLNLNDLKDPIIIFQKYVFIYKCVRSICDDPSVLYRDYLHVTFVSLEKIYVISVSPKERDILKGKTTEQRKGEDGLVKKKRVGWWGIKNPGAGTGDNDGHAYKKADFYWQCAGKRG